MNGGKKGSRQTALWLKLLAAKSLGPEFRPRHQPNKPSVCCLSVTPALRRMARGGGLPASSTRQRKLQVEEETLPQRMRKGMIEGDTQHLLHAHTGICIFPTCTYIYTDTYTLEIKFKNLDVKRKAFDQHGSIGL